MLGDPPSNTPIRGSDRSLGAVAERLRQRRGWIIAFGVFAALLGLTALVLTDIATIASVLMIGVLW